MKNKPLIIYALLLLCVSSIISCRDKQPDVSAAISKNIDTEMVQLADINVERLKISEQHLGSFFDKRYSDLIKEYENSKDYVSKVNLLNRIIEEKLFTSADKPHPSEIKTGYPGILLNSIDGNFDLAIKSNDAFVAQVKFINSKFKTLDKTALDAISFYEQLTPDQKKLYFNSSTGVKGLAPAIPAPDYQARIAQQLQLGYYHYQYHLQALFYYYYKQKTLNLLRGFEGRAQNARLIPNDKQFDIPILASRK